MAEMDIAFDGTWPEDVDAVDLAVQALDAAAAVAPELAHKRLVIGVLFTGDAELQALNREWRGKDKPTNVLSFPMLERADLLAIGDKGPPEMLGDLAIARETVMREAEQKGIACADHVAHLVIHGLLHLAGHDHEIGEAEAETMEALERSALAKMGIADPYTEQD